MGTVKMRLFRVVTLVLLGVVPSGYAAPVGCWQTSAASWYGPGFHGRITANGEVFDQYALTAASKTLPFGTIVQVARGSVFVFVRINDRGPFIAGRELDLSYRSADLLGLIHPGVGRVDWRIVGRPDFDLCE